MGGFAPEASHECSVESSQFFTTSQTFQRDVKKGAARFEVRHCSQCGEVTSMKKLTQTPDGRLVCISCENKEKKG